MLLTIDIGNTNASFVVFKNKKIIQSSEFNEKTQLSPTAPILISSVEKEDKILQRFPNLASVNLLRIKKSFLPSKYSAEIGEDRLAAAYYCLKNFSSSLIIDAGTFVTIDVTQENLFQGGYILPGPSSLLKTFNKGALLEEYPVSFSSFVDLPKTTKDACQQGIALMYKSLIQNVLELYAPKEIILTGGGKKFFATLLPNCLVINNLVHLGLYQIYIDYYQGENF
jgi:type III pantothenate kinase